jgi:hypothetical protein
LDAAPGIHITQPKRVRCVVDNVNGAVSVHHPQLTGAGIHDVPVKLQIAAHDVHGLQLQAVVFSVVSDYHLGDVNMPMLIGSRVNTQSRVDAVNGSSSCLGIVIPLLVGGKFAF